MTALRKLNRKGIAAFREYLASIRAGAEFQPSPALLYVDDFSTPVLPRIEIEPRALKTKLAAAKYLTSVLEPLESPSLSADAELWSWLALFFFDQLSPIRGGKRRPREDKLHSEQPAAAAASPRRRLRALSPPRRARTRAAASFGSSARAVPLRSRLPPRSPDQSRTHRGRRSTLLEPGHQPSKTRSCERQPTRKPPPPDRRRPATRSQLRPFRHERAGDRSAIAVGVRSLAQWNSAVRGGVAGSQRSKNYH